MTVILVRIWRFIDLGPESGTSFEAVTARPGSSDSGRRRTQRQLTRRQSPLFTKKEARSRFISERAFVLLVVDEAGLDPSRDVRDKPVHPDRNEFCRSVVDIVFRIDFAELDQLCVRQ